MGLFSDDPSSSHGVAGKIISINLPTLVVEDKDNVEKTIVVSTDTIIRKYRDAINSSDLAAGDFIVVIGSPDANAEIAAQFVRVLPPPPAPPTQATASGTTNAGETSQSPSTN